MNDRDPQNRGMRMNDNDDRYGGHNRYERNDEGHNDTYEPVGSKIGGKTICLV